MPAASVASSSRTHAIGPFRTAELESPLESDGPARERRARPVNGGRVGSAEDIGSISPSSLQHGSIRWVGGGQGGRAPPYGPITTSNPSDAPNAPNSSPPPATSHWKWSISPTSDASFGTLTPTCAAPVVLVVRAVR